MPDAYGQIREFFQDLVAPGVARLEERVSNLISNVDRFREEVERTQADIKQVLERIATIGEKTANLEGRLEGFKREVVAEVKVALMQDKVATRNHELPPRE